MVVSIENKLLDFVSHFKLTCCYRALRPEDLARCHNVRPRCCLPAAQGENSKNRNHWLLGSASARISLSCRYTSVIGGFAAQGQMKYVEERTALVHILHGWHLQK